MARAAANRIRIVGGTWRSRVLPVPDAPGLRPTPDRVRETLFNWLGQDLHGMRCLDLCAGTGALGFEALSRGAAHVDMVESDREVYAALQRTAAILQAGARLRLMRADALEFLRTAQARYDIVFLDPPYGGDLLDRLLPHLPARLLDGARVYVEDGVARTWPAPWQVSKSGVAGAVHYYLLHLGSA